MFHPFPSESTFKYQFNQEHMTISIPLPLGGKSSEDLRIPRMVTFPRISVPQVGMDLPPQEIPIPAFTIPSEYDLTVPLMGMVEVSAKVNSNYYTWEAMISAGNNTEESLSYLARFSVMADSPIKLLSFSTEGNFIFILKKYTFSTTKTTQTLIQIVVLLICLSFLKEQQKSLTLQRRLSNSPLKVL